MDLEQQIGRALGRAADHYQLESPQPLLERSLHRGLRLRRRRRLTAPPARPWRWP